MTVAWNDSHWSKLAKPNWVFRKSYWQHLLTPKIPTRPHYTKVTAKSNRAKETNSQLLSSWGTHENLLSSTSPGATATCRSSWANPRRSCSRRCRSRPPTAPCCPGRRWAARPSRPWSCAAGWPARRRISSAFYSEWSSVTPSGSSGLPIRSCWQAETDDRVPGFLND